MKKKTELPNIPMLEKPVIAININFKKKKEHLVIGDFDNVNRFIRGQKDVEIIFDKPFEYNRRVSLKRLNSKLKKDYALGPINNRECVLFYKTNN